MSLFTLTSTASGTTVVHPLNWDASTPAYYTALLSATTITSYDVAYTLQNVPHSVTATAAHWVDLVTATDVDTDGAFPAGAAAVRLVHNAGAGTINVHVSSPRK
jgi:hypothetical protein